MMDPNYESPAGKLLCNSIEKDPLTGISTVLPYLIFGYAWQREARRRLQTDGAHLDVEQVCVGDAAEPLHDDDEGPSSSGKSGRKIGRSDARLSNLKKVRDETNSVPRLSQEGPPEPCHYRPPTIEERVKQLQFGGGFELKTGLTLAKVPPARPATVAKGSKSPGKAKERAEVKVGQGQKRKRAAVAPKTGGGKGSAKAKKAKKVKKAPNRSAAKKSSAQGGSSKKTVKKTVKKSEGAPGKKQR